MTPLMTLRTAQLFQMSWPRISSGVGSRIGSMGGFSTAASADTFGITDSSPILTLDPCLFQAARHGDGRAFTMILHHIAVYTSKHY